jgi:hypothetical protein
MNKIDNIFFSCIIDNTYKEFKIDSNLNKKNIRKFIIESNHNLIKILKIIESGEYLNLKELIDKENIKLYSDLKDILLKLEVSLYFEMNIKDINNWFKAISKYACNGHIEEYTKQENLYLLGVSNTKYLNKIGVSIEDNHFVLKDKNNEKVKMLIRTKKIS